MLKNIVTLICAGLVLGASAEKSDKLDVIQKSLEKIMSKAGISIDGEFKSEYFSSKISGDGSNDSTARQTETNEFTSVDFDIKARPNEMVSGRLIFRMHQNWQNFFSDISNPIYSRWISIDGNVKDMIRFNVGDFKQKYSPLTLYTPEIEIMYEPTIFARQREIAMDENFLGDNNRVLQGVNFGFDAEIAPVFNEFHLGLIASRLQNTETSVQDGSMVTTLFDKADIAKYFVGSNLDMTFLKGINLGGTWLCIFDSKSSFKGSTKSFDTTTDTLAQRTNILSFRPGVDIGSILGSEALNFKISTEFAGSIDDTSWVYKTDTSKTIKDSTINGSAIRLGGEIGFSSGKSWGINLNGDFIMNSQYYRNELAQSPSFIGDRIMNTDNGGRQNYTTFDALYHTVFKFVPSALPASGSKTPYRKNAYYRSVFSQKMLADSLPKYMDPAVQLVMPYGPATPNRVGINMKLKGYALNEGIEVTGLFASLKEKDQVEYEGDESMLLPKAEYSQVGAGLKLDLSKMVPVFKYPFELSGSYVFSSMKQPALDTILGEFKVESGFLNAGLYYKFWKRTAILGGFQLINNSLTQADDTISYDDAYINWAIGLEWKVSEGADIVASFGQINAKIDEDDPVAKDFKQNLVDLSLRVKF